MIESIFTALYDMMAGSVWLMLAASLSWGILSILLSPCHLSSIPLLIGFLTSQEKLNTRRSFNISLLFALGILVSISLIGIITASLGRLMGDLGAYGNYFVALIFFVMGLYLLDVIKLDWNRNILSGFRMNGILAAFMLGFIFGVALGPCTFAFMAPVLGVVFQTAQENYLLSLLILSAFCLGHCGVIAGAGTLSGKVQVYLNWSSESKIIIIIKKICGLLVILGGIYLLL